LWSRQRSEQLVATVKVHSLVVSFLEQKMVQRDVRPWR
jgi:hypothetical protein